MTAVIEYEVELEVDEDVAAAFRDWLAGHVLDMLALPGFVSAACRRVLDPPPAPGRIVLCVRYALVDRDALADYLAGPAAGMRAQGQARFGGRFSARRRVLEAV